MAYISSAFWFIAVDTTPSTALAAGWKGTCRCGEENRMRQSTHIKNVQNQNLFQHLQRTMYRVHTWAAYTDLVYAMP